MANITSSSWKVYMENGGGGGCEVAGRGAVILCFITIDVDIGATCMNSALPRICFI